MHNTELNCTIKEPYYNHFVHLISFGSIWLFASYIGMKNFENISIILLFAGTCLFNPIYHSLRRLFSFCPITSDDPLRTIITCMTIAVPIGIVICFLPFLENKNAFFYVFGIMFGLVFCMAAYVYHLKRYYIIGTALVIGEIALWYFIDNFATGGFYAGGVLIFFGLGIKAWGDIKGLRIKKAIVST